MLEKLARSEEYEIIWNNLPSKFFALRRVPEGDYARYMPHGTDLLPPGERFSLYLTPAGISASPHRYPKVMPEWRSTLPLTIPYKNKLPQAGVFLRFREDLRRSATTSVRRCGERERTGVRRYYPASPAGHFICWIVIFIRPGAFASLFNHLLLLLEAV